MVFALRGFAGKPGTTFFRQFHCRKHCFRRTQLYCTMCDKNVGTERITGLICSRKLGGCISSTHSTASYPKGTSYGDAEASPSGRSTQRQGDKRSAAADLIASNAPLREGRHTARQNGPKHYPGDSRGRSPLARLSPLSFAVQRKMESPKAVGFAERPIKT